MEEKTSKPKYVYVLISVDPHNGDDIDVNVFSTSRYAKIALIENIHTDFMESGGIVDDSSESYESSEESEQVSDSDDLSSEHEMTERERLYHNHTQEMKKYTVPKELKKQYESEVVKKMPNYGEYLNAVLAKKKRYSEMPIPEPIPGFDKTNWEHMKPLIIEELDKCKKGWWEYENKYGYRNYRVVKAPINS